MEGIGFHYPSRPLQNALTDFTLDVQPGQTVAIVGPSGAGKTTVFQLLLRMYDPQTGGLLIDGVPCREMALEDFIALVAEPPAGITSVRTAVSQLQGKTQFDDDFSLIELVFD
jgi:ATP-binding cassette subfamily B protein